MPAASLGRRVEVLEERVDALSQLPERVSAVEGQIVALRAEMRDAFVSVRVEARAEFAAVRAEMHAGDEETRRYMRVLHEDVISRITLLQEGLGRSKGKRVGATRSKRRRR